MCNLYDVGPVPIREDNRWARELRKGLLGLSRLYGLGKTDRGVAVRRGGEVAEMSWGFLRDFSSSPINNCRADKLDGEMWSDSWKERRCVIPVRAYYEWKGGKGSKQTYAFRANSERWLWAAGVWEDVGDELFYSMVTTEPGAVAGAIHSRMPALLAESELEEFLGADNPKHLIRSSNDLEVFPCLNPLLKNAVAGPPVRDEPQPELFPDFFE